MADPPDRQGSTLDEALSAAAVSELDQTPDTLEGAQSTGVTAVLRDRASRCLYLERVRGASGQLES
eukprot:3494433-Rhodomonas_salina.1